MSGNLEAKYPVKALTKALRILDAVAKSPTGANVAAMSKELKIGKSTVHRLVATLRQYDLVWLDPGTLNYTLGARILGWSDVLMKQNLLLRHGLPILQELVNVCRETAHLAVLEGSEVLYVAQFESMGRLRMSEGVGNRMPAHSTSLGKALLATLSDTEIDELYRNVSTLKALSPHTITDKQRLKEHLRKVREDGIAYEFEESESGVVCIGTVVRNFTAGPIAAMSISIPTQHLPGETLVRLKDHLIKAAARLSRELGYDPDRSYSVPVQASSQAVLVS